MRGVTLLEVLVVLVVLGLLTGLAGVSLASLRSPPTSTVVRELRAARDSAIRLGRDVQWAEDSVVIRFRPDGSSTGGAVTVNGEAVAVDPVTGEVRARE